MIEASCALEVVSGDGGPRSRHERRYLLTAPELPNPDAPVPLIVALHGSLQTGAQLREFMGRSLDRLVDDEGVVVVYPDALGDMWDDARAKAPVATRDDGASDAAFVEAMLRDIDERIGPATEIDRGAVFAIGFSNGGHLGLRLVHERPGLLAGLGLISATLPVASNFDLVDRYRPIPIVQVHGTRDPISPYDGGEATLFGQVSRGEVLGAEATALSFARRKGIEADATRSLIDERGRLSITRIAYVDGEHPPVVLYRVDGGGHTCPNLAHDNGLVLGRTYRGRNATDLIWSELLAAHTCA